MGTLSQVRLAFVTKVSLPVLLLFGAALAPAQTLSIASGNGQLICSECPFRSFSFDSLVVLLKDSRGIALPNVTVTWTVSTPRGVDAFLGSTTTLTGPDGTSSNTLKVSQQLGLLTTWSQALVTASAMGSSVTFTETNGTVDSRTGIVQVSSNLLSPMPGTTLVGGVGAVSSVPVQIVVSSIFPGGPVPGVEIRAVSDPSYPATAVCAAGAGNPVNSVLTDATGHATCNVQFGNVSGDGRVKFYVGGNYEVFGPFAIQVSGNGPPPPPPPGSGLLVPTPKALTFQYPGPTSQTVSVASTTGTIGYTASLLVILRQVTWLTVGAPSGPATTSGSSSFSVTISPLSLQPGTYQSDIQLHPDNGTGDVVVPVTLNVGTGGGAGTGQLSATPRSLTFQYPGPGVQMVSVTSSSGTVPYTTAVQSASGPANWLSVGAPSGPASANGPSTFPVAVSPQFLPSGSYQATIAVHPSNGTADVTISLQLTVQAPAITVSPQVLNLTQMAGGPPPSVNAISVSSSGAALQFDAAVTGASWLSVSAARSTPGLVLPSVNAATLAPGNYTGTITITAPGAANSPLSVMVNLQVKPVLTLLLSTASLNFASQAGAAAPPSQTIGATASFGSLPFSVQVNVISPIGGNWLNVTPTSGTAGSTGASLQVSVDPTGLAPGNYAATILVTAANAANPPQTINVIYTVTAPAPPAPAGVVNAASGLAGAISPGEIVLIQGSNLGPLTGVTADMSGTSVGNQISDTQVTFDNMPAPLLYVSATQIKAVVPYGVVGRPSVNLVVTYKNVASPPTTLNIADSAPGIFVVDNSTQGVIFNADGSANRADNPAAAGSTVVIYITGEGVTDPPGVDGSITPDDNTQWKTPVLPVTAAIGGSPAQVLAATSVPEAVAGTLQVTVVIPDDAPAGGAVPVVVTVGGVDSQTATIAIQ